MKNEQRTKENDMSTLKFTHPEKYFDELLFNWFQRLIVSKNSLLVAIVRKCPRLIEYLVAEAKKNGIEIDVDDLNVISDCALPFVLPTLLKENDNQCYYNGKLIDNIILLDEAIYFGSTFEMIYGIILTGLKHFDSPLSKQNVHSLPAVVSEDARRIKDILKFDLFNDVDFDKLLIEKELIPLYIDFVLSKFRELGKPCDVEFPIIYLKLKENSSDGNKSKFIGGELEKLRKRLLPNSVQEPYVTDHYTDSFYSDSNFGVTESIDSWTLLLDELSFMDKHVVSPDFQKIRVFFTSGNEKLSLASYAPCAIPQRLLIENSPLFEGTALAPLWKKVFRAAKVGEKEFEPSYQKVTDALAYENMPEDTHFMQWYLQTKQYQEQTKKSLVVWANYLLSFAKLLDISKELKNLFDFESNVIDIVDLNYLIGHDLAKEIRLELLNLLQSDAVVQLPTVYIDPIKQFKLIPEDYQRAYEKHNQSDFFDCTSISGLVSAEFSNQHKYIEIPSRRPCVHQNVDRLKFGVTYTSMMDDFYLYFGNRSDRLRVRIHKAVDRRVDRGSIVPKYVNVDGTYLRLFRAGENEDQYKDQLNRLLLLILKMLKEETKRNEIPERIINTCFNFTLSGEILPEEKLRLLRGIEFSTQLDGKGWGYKTFFCDREKKQSVLQHCIDSGLLIKSSLSYYKLSNDFDSDEAIVVNKEINDLLRQRVQLVATLYSSLSASTVREICNWSLVQDEEKEGKYLENLQQELEKIRKELKLFISNQDARKLDNLKKHIIDVFDAVPDNDIEDIKEEMLLQSEKFTNEVKILYNKLYGSVSDSINRSNETPKIKELNDKVSCFDKVILLLTLKFSDQKKEKLEYAIDDLQDKLSARLAEASLNWLETMKDASHFENEQGEGFDLNILKIVDII
ncbi:hypothetical protein AGMMS50262_20400 [Bacteroidia bacterium]|nr:hypothetical protein AGMMS50262_20400 [Bacteroidia bacterium]